MLVMPQTNRGRTLDPTEAAWLAGLLDGDGTIAMPRRHRNEHRQLEVSISNTDFAPLEYVKSIVGMGRITRKRTMATNHAPSGARAKRGKCGHPFPFPRSVLKQAIDDLSISRFQRLVGAALAANGHGFATKVAPTSPARIESSGLVPCQAHISFVRNEPADHERRRRRRRWRVQDMDRPGRLFNPEIIDKVPSAVDRLGPHAGTAAGEVIGGDLGHEALQAFHEHALTQRTVYLGDAGFPVAPDQTPETTVRQC